MMMIAFHSFFSFIAFIIDPHELHMDPRDLPRTSGPPANCPFRLSIVGNQCGCDCMHVYVQICVCVCVCICMYVCIYIHR